MVTGRLDANHYTRIVGAHGSEYADHDVAQTQCSRILPFSVNSFNDEREETFGYKVRIVVVMLSFSWLTEWAQFEGTVIFWGILKMFGYHLQPELAGDKINRLENVMTLSLDVHGLFDDLDFWLE